MTNLKIDIAAEFTGAKAFKKAETSTDKLSKGVKKLGGAMAAAFSAQAIANFGKASVKAFMEDEKAASRLAKVVDNLGLSFANPQITKFIDDLTLATGVADDKLRPAFQALLTTTGSLTNSQELLKNAIDISAGSGVDLAIVAQDLASAYVGNTKGLKKYNLGLSQAQLKTKSFTQIQKLMNEQFGGSNQAYLQTYAGKMELITNAAGEAQETIGSGLVEAFSMLAGSSGGVEELTVKMQELADTLSNAFIGVAAVFDGISEHPIFGKLVSLAEFMTSHMPNLYTLLGWLSGQGAKSTSAGLAPASANAHLAALEGPANAKKAAAAEAAAKKRAAELLRSQKANTTELKKQTLTKKQQGLFDLEQVQRIAALKGQLTEEDAKKVRLQLALIQGNEYEAKKLTEEIANSIDSTGKLAESLRTLPDAKNPFAAWRGYLDELELQAKRVASYANQNQSQNQAVMPVIGGSIPIPTTNAGGIAGGNNVTGFNRFGVETGGNQTIKIDLNVDGKLLAQVLQDASLNGNQVYVNRITGGFYQ